MNSRIFRQASSGIPFAPSSQGFCSSAAVPRDAPCRQVIAVPRKTFPTSRLKLPPMLSSVGNFCVRITHPSGVILLKARVANTSAQAGGTCGQGRYKPEWKWPGGALGGGNRSLREEPPLSSGRLFLSQNSDHFQSSFLTITVNACNIKFTVLTISQQSF